MSRQLDPLQKSLVDDLHKVLAKDKQLHEFWHVLPDSGREAVEDAFLEMVWQMMFSAADAKGPGVRSRPELERMLREFGGFVKMVVAGKSAVLETAQWVALDRKTYVELKASVELAAEKSEPTPSEKSSVDFVTMAAAAENGQPAFVLVGLTDDIIEGVKRNKMIIQDSSRTKSGFDVVLFYRPKLNGLVKELKRYVEAAGKKINVRLT